MNKLTNLIRVCHDLAEVIEEKHNKYADLANDLGMGYKVLTNYLRQGIIEVIVLESRYWKEREQRELARMELKDNIDFIAELFGEIPVELLAEMTNEEEKAKLKKVAEEIVLGMTEESDTE